MTGRLDDLELDSLKQEAIGWVRRLTSGAVTAAEAEQFKRWRSKSPEHAAAFAAASNLWRDLGVAGENVRKRQRSAGSHSRNAGVRLLHRRAFLGGGLAAASIAAGVYVAARPPLDLWPSIAELSADYRTRTGEQRDVSFADIAIRMNTRTSIAREPSSSDMDRVRLITGEASFATAGQGRTLSVIAADSEIAATAARFDVSYLQDADGTASVCATCLQGELRVARGAEATTVVAGQKIRYAANGAKDLHQVDVDVVSAWQEGVLVFRNTALKDVVNEVNRYRGGRIIVTNAQIGGVPVSGRFRISRIDDILTQMEQAFGAKMRQLPGGIVLLS